jgi:hypothetical protein
MSILERKLNFSYVDGNFTFLSALELYLEREIGETPIYAEINPIFIS